jgi:hypothetical protein
MTTSSSFVPWRYHASATKYLRKREIEVANDDELFAALEPVIQFMLNY